MPSSDLSPARRIVVTGGASGIGAATVRLLASHGGALAIIDRNDPAETLELPAHVLRADVADAAEISSAVADAAERLGGIDVLVTAAGITSRGTIEDTEPEDWDTVFAVNVRGTYLAARAAMPHLRRGRDPAIVTVASQLGLVANAGNAAYCASKGAVIQLTRAMAIDAIRHGIRVNSVCPGATRTPLTAAHYSGEADKGDQQAQLLGRLIEPEEIAGGIAYLASAESRATVGAILVVDGGYTIH
jgi:NAD(P)-dependent dehydrogenase (short-subunit alcohol dehydrogenase family)